MTWSPFINYLPVPQLSRAVMHYDRTNYKIRTYVQVHMSDQTGVQKYYKTGKTD